MRFMGLSSRRQPSKTGQMISFAGSPGRARARPGAWARLTSRVGRRTVRRRLRDEELWHGNREAPLRTFFTDREHVVRWSIRTRHLLDERVPAVATERPGLPVVRLRSARQVERWLAEVLRPLASSE